MRRERRHPVEKTVIDVSQFNGAPAWSVAARHVDGAILRIGFRGYATGALQKDARFAENLAAVQRAGIPYGAYFVTQAITPDEARAEADWAARALCGAVMDFPLYLDSEYGAAAHDGRADTLGMAARTRCAAAFLERLDALGVRGGVYASDSWFSAQLDRAGLAGTSLWVARYSAQKPVTPGYDAWQFTSTGTCPGVTGFVDKSYFYKMFAKTTQLSPAGQEAVGKLAALGVIRSPEYWRENGGAMRYLDVLLIAAAGAIKKSGAAAPSVAAAVEKLAAAGVVNTPAYWLANANALRYLPELLMLLGGAV
ncbi:MAG: GH25 family lysozyme [Oscillospiraceae bacterium]|nr:GH25 family lysozyme [Oscillospiraceae bacterium]